MNSSDREEGATSGQQLPATARAPLTTAAGASRGLEPQGRRRRSPTSAGCPARGAPARSTKTNCQSRPAVRAEGLAPGETRSPSRGSGQQGSADPGQGAHRQRGGGPGAENPSRRSTAGSRPDARWCVMSVARQQGRWRPPCAGLRIADDVRQRRGRASPEGRDSCSRERGPASSFGRTRGASRAGYGDLVRRPGPFSARARHRPVVVVAAVVSRGGGRLCVRDPWPRPVGLCGGRCPAIAIAVLTLAWRRPVAVRGARRACG